MERFVFENNQVRLAVKDGQPWFVAKDVCDVLGLSNSRKAIENLDEDEKGVTISDTPGGHQEVATINESGLYTLILRSRKAAARRFRKWVTAEVLPSIRKTGGYSVGPPHDACILQEAVAKASAHEAACLRIALYDVAKRNGVTDPDEFSTLARESLSNGDANPNPKLWEIADPHPETVKRVMKKMVEALSKKPMLNA